MKKNLSIFIAFMGIALTVFSQTGWELGISGGTNFNRANPFADWCESPPLLNDSRYGYSINLKSAYNFHPNFSVEMIGGITSRTVYPGIGNLGRCFDLIYIRTPHEINEVLFENQVRFRYKLLANRRVQPWVSGGLVQFVHLGYLDKHIPGGYPPEYDVRHLDASLLPAKYQIGYVAAAGVRVKVWKQFHAEFEANLRATPHFRGTDWQRMLGGTNVGIVYSL